MQQVHALRAGARGGAYAQRAQAVVVHQQRIAQLQQQAREQAAVDA